MNTQAWLKRALGQAKPFWISESLVLTLGSDQKAFSQPSCKCNFLYQGDAIHGFYDSSSNSSLMNLLILLWSCMIPPLILLKRSATLTCYVVYKWCRDCNGLKPLHWLSQDFRAHFLILLLQVDEEHKSLTNRTELSTTVMGTWGQALLQIFKEYLCNGHLRTYIPLQIFH